MWRKITINPLFGVVGLAYVLGGQGKQMLIAFLVITLHELTHAVVAESYGLTVDRIEIWPFGGIARISGVSAQEPYVETMIAVVGPLQNFLLAAVAWLAAKVLPFDGYWVSYFIEVNLVLGAVNLLPVSPLDGGHLAKAYLARMVGYDRAGQIIRRWGILIAQVMLVITAISFVFGRPLLSLGLFGGFLYWGAKKNDKNGAYLIVRDMYLRPSVFKKRPLWSVDDFAVRFDTPISHVLKSMRPLKYHRVVVLDADLHKLGTLYEEDIIRGMENHGPTSPVGQLLVR